MPSSLKPTWSSACLGTEVADRFLAAHRALTGMDHHPFWDVACVVDVVPELDSPGPPPEPWLGHMEDLLAAALARLGQVWFPESSAPPAGAEDVDRGGQADPALARAALRLGQAEASSASNWKTS